MQVQVRHATGRPLHERRFMGVAAMPMFRLPTRRGIRNGRCSTPNIGKKIARDQTWQSLKIDIQIVMHQQVFWVALIVTRQIQIAAIICFDLGLVCLYVQRKGA